MGFLKVLIVSLLIFSRSIYPTNDNLDEFLLNLLRSMTKPLLQTYNKTHLSPHCKKGVLGSVEYILYAVPSIYSVRESV